MNRSLYVVVFVGIFLGCATPQSGPTEYQRGATTPARPAPRVTHTPAGAGMGAPGSPEHEYPRSPHKRILPETPETRRGPGFWATEAPTTPSRQPPPNWKTTYPQAGGIYIPLMVEYRQDDQMQLLVHRCAMIVDSIVSSLVAKDARKSLAPKWPCLIALLNEHCASQDVLWVDKRTISEGGKLSAKFDAALRVYLGNALLFKDRVCNSDNEDDEVKDWAVKLIKKWDMFDWRYEEGALK